VGRTGRAGRAGVGITFVLPDQARDAARMAVALGLKREFERSGLPIDRADHTGPRSGAAPRAARSQRSRRRRRR
jgi:superfamily II DNA/RNA helicase